MKLRDHLYSRPAHRGCRVAKRRHWRQFPVRSGQVRRPSVPGLHYRKSVYSYSALDNRVFERGTSSDAWVKLDQLDDFPSDVGMRVLKIILEFACIAQHIGAIEAGRAAFERIPLEWLVKYLQDVVGQTLDLTDEWQFSFRRLLELVMDIMPDKFKIYIDLGLASGLAEIVSTANEFRSRNRRTME